MSEPELTPEEMADFERRYARAHAGIIDDRSVEEMTFGQAMPGTGARGGAAAARSAATRALSGGRSRKQAKAKRPAA